MLEQTADIQTFLTTLLANLDSVDRVVVPRVHTSLRGDGSKWIGINYFNLPDAVFARKEGNGAEAENNRFSVHVHPVAGGKMVVETGVNHIGSFGETRKWNLRKKTAKPEALAKYVAAHLNKIAAEVPPKLTHTRSNG